MMYVRFKRLSSFLFGSIETVKFITPAIDARRHYDPHKLSLFVVDLLPYLIFMGNELEDATLSKAPATTDLFPWDETFLCESVDRLYVDPQ